MSLVVMFRETKKKTLVVASGRHAEVLAEMVAEAKLLLRFIESERAGTFDSLGQSFRVGTDPVLNTSRRLVGLAERRIAELRDAGPR